MSVNKQGHRETYTGEHGNCLQHAKWPPDAAKLYTLALWRLTPAHKQTDPEREVNGQESPLWSHKMFFICSFVCLFLNVSILIHAYQMKKPSQANPFSLQSAQHNLLIPALQIAAALFSFQVTDGGRGSVCYSIDDVPHAPTPSHSPPSLPPLVESCVDFRESLKPRSVFPRVGWDNLSSWCLFRGFLLA